MRSTNCLILAPLLLIGAVLAAPLGSSIAPAQGGDRTEVHQHDFDRHEGCAHCRKLLLDDSPTAAKVDSENYPDAVCAAPELPAHTRSNPVSLDAHSAKFEELAPKRNSVTLMVRQALADQKRMLQAKDAELERWGSNTQTHFARWFGTIDEKSRETIRQRIVTLLKINQNYSEANFRRSEHPTPGIFAYVRSNDPTRVFLDGAFVSAPAIGVNSKAGTLVHEMSHFRIAGGTKDHAYGPAKCLELARTNPAFALINADNFEYFVENAR